MESKIRILIGKLEYNGGIELAHVNCKTFNPDPVTYVSHLYMCMPSCCKILLCFSSELSIGMKDTSCDGLSASS